MVRVVSKGEYQLQFKDYTATGQIKVLLGHKYEVCEKKITGCWPITVIFIKAVACTLLPCFFQKENRKKHWEEFKNRKRILYCEASSQQTISKHSLPISKISSHHSANPSNSSDIKRAFFKDLFDYKLGDKQVKEINGLSDDDASCIEELLGSLEKDLKVRPVRGHAYYSKLWNPVDERYEVVFSLAFTDDSSPNALRKSLPLTRKTFADIVCAFITNKYSTYLQGNLDVAIDGAIVRGFQLVPEKDVTVIVKIHPTVFWS